MDRIRRVVNKNYTTISNVALRDKNLSLKAKGFITYIFSLADNWDFTINGISSLLKESKGAIYTIIAELEDNGYCERIQQKGEDGRFGAITYTFNESPNSVTEQQIYPLLENPHTDNPQTESPHTENQPQRNTNSKEILNSKNDICNEVVKLYHSILPMLSKIKKLNRERRSKIVSRLREMDDGIKTMEYVFQKIALSSFLMGKNKTGWRPDFDWIIKNDYNWVKVIEGKYDNGSNHLKEGLLKFNTPQQNNPETFEEI